MPSFSQLATCHCIHFSEPPYDPNGPFNISSLHKLENAGIKIVTSFLENFSCLQTATGIVLEDYAKENWFGNQRHDIECLDIVINRWESSKGQYPANWKSLLHVVSEKMNLKELSQQIEKYLTGKY